MSGRFCLVGDGDGHHWLCPIERLADAKAVLRDLEKYGDEMPDCASPPDLDQLGFTRVDNPNRLTFADPREEL